MAIQKCRRLCPAQRSFPPGIQRFPPPRDNTWHFGPPCLVAAISTPFRPATLFSPPTIRYLSASPSQVYFRTGGGLLVQIRNVSLAVNKSTSPKRRTNRKEKKETSQGIYIITIIVSTWSVTTQKLPGRCQPFLPAAHTNARRPPTFNRKRTHSHRDFAPAHAPLLLLLLVSRRPPRPCPLHQSINHPPSLFHDSVSVLRPELSLVATAFSLFFSLVLLCCTGDKANPCLVPVTLDFDAPSFAIQPPFLFHRLTYL
jgi:hypothetical protein